jgi:hypothetical protein
MNNKTIIYIYRLIAGKVTQRAKGIYKRFLMSRI